IHRQDADWWPLLGVAAAVVVWGVLVAMHRRTTSGQVAAAALFLAGGVGYAISTTDWPGAVTAVVATARLTYIYPRIARGAERLTAAKPAVGLDSYAGEMARVSEWDGGRGRVVLHGSLWSATGPADL